jgi:hypothetical protein
MPNDTQGQGHPALGLEGVNRSSNTLEKSQSFFHNLLQLDQNLFHLWQRFDTKMQKIPSKDELKRLRRRKREMMGPDAPESSDDEQAHNDYCNAAINADAHNLHLKNDSFGRNDNKNISQNDVKSAESLRLDVLPVSPPTTDSFKENQQLTPVTMKNFGQPPLSSQVFNL